MNTPFKIGDRVEWTGAPLGLSGVREHRAGGSGEVIRVEEPRPASPRMASRSWRVVVWTDQFFGGRRRVVHFDADCRRLKFEKETQP